MTTFDDTMTSAGLTYGELIGSNVEIPCAGSHEQRAIVPCDRFAQTLLCAGMEWFACHEHWREVSAHRWFHKSDCGTMLATDDAGTWIHVGQGWDLDREWPPHPCQCHRAPTPPPTRPLAQPPCGSSWLTWPRELAGWTDGGIGEAAGWLGAGTDKEATIGGS
jgi:hypothetical protein